jgi:hypothetical protein
LYSRLSFILFDKVTRTRNASATRESKAGYTIGMCCFPIEEGDDGELDASGVTDDGDASEYENERNLSVR